MYSDSSTLDCSFAAPARLQHMSPAILLFSFVCYLHIITLASAASPDAGGRQIHKRGIMNKIAPFVQSLDIPSSQAEHLTATLDHDPNLEACLKGKNYDTSSLVKLACLSAEVCLGADSVDTTPVNQTEVDNNWSVNTLECGRELKV